jgi:hypothetical protein
MAMLSEAAMCRRAITCRQKVGCVWKASNGTSILYLPKVTRVPFFIGLCICVMSGYYVPLLMSFVHNMNNIQSDCH